VGQGNAAQRRGVRTDWTRGNTLPLIQFTVEHEIDPYARPSKIALASKWPSVIQRVVYLRTHSKIILNLLHWNQTCWKHLHVHLGRRVVDWVHSTDITGRRECDIIDSLLDKIARLPALLLICGVDTDGMQWGESKIDTLSIDMSYPINSSKIRLRFDRYPQPIDLWQK